jgi:uncharacterized membrane protein
MFIGLALHVLGAIIWIGGLFFALLVLWPSARPLEGSIRLPLWNRVLGRLRLWGWISSAVLVVSGFAMLFVGFGGFAMVPIYVRAMMALGITTIAAYAYLSVAPWRRFRRAVAIGDWTLAERRSLQMRLLVAITLALGLVTAVVGASGRYYG